MSFHGTEWKKWGEIEQVNFMFCFRDDVLSLNNSKFGGYNWTPISNWAWARNVSYLDLHLEIDNEGRLIQNLETKEMISIFLLWTFHLCAATFQQHLHMEYISQSWCDIPELVVPIMIYLIRVLLLTRKLLDQWFLFVKVKSSLRKFNSHCHELVNRYGISVSQICSICHSYNPVLI
jgi:hypothetical protein